MLKDRPIALSSLFRGYWKSISLTWALTLCETAGIAFVPLFVGFAIDGLLEDNFTSFIQLGSLLIGLVAVSVARRLFDTRIYGRIRVEVGKTLLHRSKHVTVSSLNARMNMARELVDFFEQEMPISIESLVQLIVSLLLLYAFMPILAGSALLSAVLILCLYALFHGRFFFLNGQQNQLLEGQVDILTQRSRVGAFRLLNKLRKVEIKQSDTEALVYGLIFVVLFGFLLFNLWFSTSGEPLSVGSIFSIVSYSWQFIESALVAPMTLQSWSRLSEITARINPEIRPQN